MKWIGQHIWDYISRFRNDVYLEDISTGTIASGGNLGLDSNNKIVKADTEAGELSFNGNTANGVLTYGDTSTIDVEPSLTYTGNTLSLNGTMGILQADGTPGGTTLGIVNLDADQVVGSFYGVNTTADVIDISATSLTTGSIIDCSATCTTSSLLDFDISNAETGTSVATFLDINFDKTGVTADSEVFAFTGIKIDFDDTATNHANSTQINTGIDIALTNSSDQGTVYQTGLNIYCQGSDAASTNGMVLRTPELANDIKIQSYATGSDIFTVQTKTDGETTLTTLEDGGGSTAHFNVVADGDIVLDSASGNIKTGSTTFVNNSGVVQVATQGTIDHDSLANFVAAEHYRWDTDISSTATIHTNNITDLHGAGVDGSANQLLTDDGDGTVTSEAGLTYSADVLYLQDQTNGFKPAISLENRDSAATKCSLINFIKTKGAPGADGDQVGIIYFSGGNSLQQNTGFAQITAGVATALDTDEAGSFNIDVATSNGTTSALRDSITLTGHATSDYVDAAIGYGANSTTTIAGMLESTGRVTIKNNDFLYFNDNDNSHATRVQSSTTSTNRTITLPDATGTVALQQNHLHILTSNFYDDIGTTKHYIPISTQSTSEQTSDGNTITDFLVPCSLKVKEVMVKLPSTTTGSGNLTVGIETSNIGDNPTSKSIVETETVAVTSSNDNDIVHFMFDDTTHATIGQNLSITIQSSADLSGFQNWYVTTILEFDLTTRHTSSSAVQTS